MPSNVCISWRSCMAMITQAQPTGWKSVLT
jgi:hypothetical protein